MNLTTRSRYSLERTAEKSGNTAQVERALRARFELAPALPLINKNVQQKATERTKVGTAVPSCPLLEAQDLYKEGEGNEIKPKHSKAIAGGSSIHIDRNVNPRRLA